MAVSPILGESHEVEEEARRFIGAVEEGKKEEMSMKFEVCGVKKPLAAVWRIAGKGNRVCFGPGEEDNYIQNVSDGRKMMMRRKGGSYVIDIVMNGETQEIIKGS